jgi:hypothetical protein
MRLLKKNKQFATVREKTHARVCPAGGGKEKIARSTMVARLTPCEGKAKLTD